MAKVNKEDEKIVEQAKKEFAIDLEYESESRKLFIDDLKFANADSDNKFQWDAAYVKSRETSNKPCLTINKVKQHNNQITNEFRQNKPTVKVMGVDDKSDSRTAAVLNDVVRHIESNSSAQTAYDTAGEFAVDAGIGYWRILTDYADENSFDQEIYIQGIKNPLNVLLDSRIQNPDGSDAKRGFIFKDMSKEDFEAEHPDADAVSWTMDAGDEWLGKDMIRVAEYFKVSDAKDTLYELPDGTTVKKSELSPEEAKMFKANKLKSREIKSPKIDWYLIAGDQILDRKEWLGRYIPIVRVVGEEKEIEGKLERKGHTRSMKDAQRMYNYNSSASIEHGALQTKTPITGAAEAFEGYEDYWKHANTENFAYLPYNHVDEAGNPIATPSRIAPPTTAALYLDGMQVAKDEMNITSGQYDAQFGNNPNAQSGRALNALQRKGDIATFHYIDNVARSIKYTGMILVDLIPKVYDTKRIVRMLGEDGADSRATLDPDAEQPYQEVKSPNGEIEKIFNPTLGRYDVDVTVGASYTTKRQEAFEALNEMAGRNPRFMELAGDIIMSAADFPMADKLAERLKKTIPPELIDDEDGEANPEVDMVKQQAQEVIGQLEQRLEAAEGALAEADEEAKQIIADKENGEAQAINQAKKNENDALKLEIEAYKAETERLALGVEEVANAMDDPAMPEQIANDTGVAQALIERIDYLAQQNQEIMNSVANKNKSIRLQSADGGVYEAQVVDGQAQVVTPSGNVLNGEVQEQ